MNSKKSSRRTSKKRISKKAKYPTKKLSKGVNNARKENKSTKRSLEIEEPNKILEKEDDEEERKNLYKFPPSFEDAEWHKVLK